MTHPRDPTNKPADEGLTILANAEPASRNWRWRPVPAIVLGLALVYCVTVVVGSVTVITVNIQNTHVAQACIQAGGSWVISESGDRECRRGDRNG